MKFNFYFFLILTAVNPSRLSGLHERGQREKARDGQWSLFFHHACHVKARASKGFLREKTSDHDASKARATLRSHQCVVNPPLPAQVLHLAG